MLSSATTRCGLLLSSAFAAAFNGVFCFIGAGASGFSDQDCGAETGVAAGASELAGCPGAVCISFSTTVAATSERRCSCCARACACFSACLGCGYSFINFAVDMCSV